MSDHLLAPGMTPDQNMRVEPIAGPDPKLATRADYDPAPADTRKYYYLETRNASMYTPQAKRIPFIHNIAACDIAADQRYLDGEIAAGSVPHLRHATPEEIQNYKMLTNPRAVIREQVQEELLQDPNLQRQLRQQVLDDLINSGQEVPEELKKFILADPTRPVLATDEGGHRTHVNQATGGADVKSALEKLRLGGTGGPAEVRLTGMQTTTDVKDMSGI